ncbi:MAG: hypothetical protein H6943_06665 [Zoogloeaceae bacterium]|nr:hypothetical protein [Zoogloeaceae bacterium]
MAVTASGLSASSIEALYSNQSERNLSTSVRQGESAAQPAANPERPATDAGVNGIAAQQSSEVRISTSGQAQVALDNVQTAARALQTARQEDVVSEVRQLAESFAETFNTERVALTRAAENTFSADAAERAQAGAAAAQLQSVVSNAAAPLRDAGVQVSQDGSLSVDAKALEAAFSTNPAAVVQTFGDVGRAAEATGIRAATDSGSAETAGNAIRLNPAASSEGRDRQSPSRPAETPNRSGEQQSAVESTARRYGFGAVGAGAYLGIFGL